ncbi:MAG: hypothetical protein CL946_09795 [Ectothiorhodospiraceae bacterium]|nr:hypothetical protein [Ectothiorhodospiraceae bacterium]
MHTDTLQTVADTTAVWTKTGWDSILAGDGLSIAMAGLLIVFSSLAILTVLIYSIAAIIKSLHQRQIRAEQGEDAEMPKNGISGEVVAAIALALNAHVFELHDEERTIVTIQKVSKPYSPWSSKLHNMTKTPTFISGNAGRTK